MYFVVSYSLSYHISRFLKEFLFFSNPLFLLQMKTNSEGGHAQNVANFQDLITCCKSYGTKYNPAQENLQLPQLESLLDDAQQALDIVIAKVTIYNRVVSFRQNTFAGIKPLFTKIINAFAITGASAQSIADAKALNKKIRGKRIGKKSIASTSTDSATMLPAKNISVSQQSYDDMIEHTAKLISLLSAEPSYKPNEVELQVPTLNTLLKAMKDSTEAVSIADTTLSNARISRDKLLYQTDTGLHFIAAAVKKYVKSVFGSKAPEYKQISGIPFRIIKQ